MHSSTHSVRHFWWYSVLHSDTHSVSHFSSCSVQHSSRHSVEHSFWGSCLQIFSYVVVQCGFHTSSHLISQCCCSFFSLLNSVLKAPFTRPFPKRCPPCVRARSPSSVTISKGPPFIFSQLQLVLVQVKQGVMMIFGLHRFLSS